MKTTSFANDPQTDSQSALPTYGSYYQIRLPRLRGAVDSAIEDPPEEPTTDDAAHTTGILAIPRMLGGYDLPPPTHPSCPMATVGVGVIDA